MTVKLPHEINFRTPPPSPGQSTTYAKGTPQVALLYGDPRKPGLYVVQVKLPANYHSEAHTHPEEHRVVVVLAGTLYFGVGDAWDESKLQAFPTGTFFNEPHTLSHFAATKETEVVIQITGIGPSGVIPSKPK